MMNARKKKALTAALQERRQEIQEQIDQMGDEQRQMGIDQGIEQGTLSNHMADDGSMVFEAERLATVSDDMREMLANIDAALERIEDGTYGLCLACGKPIAEERLDAFPYVAYCIEDQARLERDNQLRAGR
jgi:RNA polymerase-binding transcription factor DksA